MPKNSERRRFPRILVAEDARALDLNGGELGRVSSISGGGLLIDCSSDSVADHLMEEGLLSIVIVEPRSQATDPIEVAVRYREGKSVGFAFIESSHEAAGAAQ